MIIDTGYSIWIKPYSSFQRDKKESEKKCSTRVFLKKKKTKTITHQFVLKKHYYYILHTIINFNYYYLIIMKKK